MRLASFLLLAMCTVIALGSSATNLIDAPSAIIVLGSSVGGLLASFGRDFPRACRTLFRRAPSAGQLRLAVAVFDRGKSFVIAGSTIGTFIGLVIILKNLDDPTAIGPVLALAFLTMVYGLFLAYGVLAPLVGSLQRRLDELAEEKPT